MIIINNEKCIKCMSCVTACPFKALQEADGNPQIDPEMICLKCMHCGAVCPVDAIAYDDVPATIDMELTEKTENFANELKTHIITRRSYRIFEDKPVSRNIIEEALDLASWAPSTKNQHPTKWIVIDDKEVIKKIVETIVKYVDESGNSPEIAQLYRQGKNVVTGTAPTLIIAYARDNAIYPHTDATIAMTTVELYLQAKGIGTCWAGYLNRLCNTIPELKELLPQIPEGNSFYGAFMVGYPKDEKFIHIPNRLKRADIKWV